MPESEVMVFFLRSLGLTEGMKKGRLGKAALDARERWGDPPQAAHHCCKLIVFTR
jgi:hypothetical protein